MSLKVMHGYASQSAVYRKSMKIPRLSREKFAI